MAAMTYVFECMTPGSGSEFLLENVCQLVDNFVVLYAQARPSDYNYLLLPADQDIGLSASFPSLCLPACYHASCHGNNGLNPWNFRPALIRCFPLKVLRWSWCLFRGVKSYIREDLISISCSFQREVHDVLWEGHSGLDMKSCAPSLYATYDYWDSLPHSGRFT